MRIPRKNVKSGRVEALLHLRTPPTQLDGGGDEGESGGRADPRLEAREESCDVEKAPDARGCPDGFVVDDRGLPTCARTRMERQYQPAYRTVPQLVGDQLAAEEPPLDEDC